MHFNFFLKDNDNKYCYIFFISYLVIHIKYMA